MSNPTFTTPGAPTALSQELKRIAALEAELEAAQAQIAVPYKNLLEAHALMQQKLALMVYERDNAVSECEQQAARAAENFKRLRLVEAERDASRAAAAAWKRAAEKWYAWHLSCMPPAGEAMWNRAIAGTAQLRRSIAAAMKLRDYTDDESSDLRYHNDRRE